MTKTVIELALEAGFWREHINTWMCSTEDIELFANLARADERNSWPAEMEAMERQVNILTDALAQAQPAREWVGLTDEERRELRKCNQQHDAFAKAIEAKLKERNHD